MVKLFLWWCIAALALTGNKLYSQEPELKRSSIKIGAGVGMNEGENEIGNGIVYSVGWQKSFGKKNKLRINPNVLIGGFLPIGITDTRDQFYRITSLSLNVHYDLLRYKAVSIVVSNGGFFNYSRGLLGTGGWFDVNYNGSEYFAAAYFGYSGAIGLRIAPAQRRFAYELRPINIQIGNNRFILSCLMLGIDFKLKAK